MKDLKEFNLYLALIKTIVRLEIMQNPPDHFLYFTALLHAQLSFKEKNKRK